MTNNVVIPDLIEPFLGWRCWGVELRRGVAWLVSHGDVEWPHTGPLLAECHARGEHPPPAKGCSCGIYALADVEIPYYSYDGDYQVFGKVALYGRVVKGTRGYRAEKARPLELCVAHKDFALAKPLRRAYDVPVRLVDPYAFIGA
jgi:hypothetical protein